ncbi:MAG: hypothetical protein HOQ22_11055, partial [Nocardioidaceae bacterium]|nr:hypothetical protein [Nocardioidaceae bacterium]
GSCRPGCGSARGSDWADLPHALPFREASPGVPDRDVRAAQPGRLTLAGVSAGDGRATVYVAIGARTYAVTGADASTWTPVRTR